MTFDLNGRFIFSGLEVAVLAILLILLTLFWLNHQEDAARIQQLQNDLSSLQIRYTTLENEHNQLKNNYSKLKMEYDKFKKDTSDLLAEYFVKEAAWDITGLNKYRTLICALQIYLRDSMPIINTIPC